MKKLMTSIIGTIALLFCTANAFAQPDDLLSAAAKAEFERQNFAPCIAEMSKIILREPKNDAALVEWVRCLFLSADDANDEIRHFKNKKSFTCANESYYHQKIKHSDNQIQPKNNRRQNPLALF